MGPGSASAGSRARSGSAGASHHRSTVGVGGVAGPERGGYPAAVVRAALLLCHLAFAPAVAPQAAAYTVNEGVEIPGPVLPRLQALAAAYMKETGKPLVITDGTRRPATQAGLMLRNLERGDAIVRLYANKSAAAAVQAAWDEARAAGLDRAAILARLTEVIAAQVAAGDYVSKHLREGAVDVRCADMSAAERARFKKLARALDIAVVDESRTSTPHFHLNFVR